MNAVGISIYGSPPPHLTSASCRCVVENVTTQNHQTIHSESMQHTPHIHDIQTSSQRPHHLSIYLHPLLPPPRERRVLFCWKPLASASLPTSMLIVALLVVAVPSSSSLSTSLRRSVVVVVVVVVFNFKKREQRERSHERWQQRTNERTNERATVVTELQRYTFTFCAINLCMLYRAFVATKQYS